jgi:hypothetical protein
MGVAYLYNLPIGNLFAEAAEAQREVEVGACSQAESDLILSIYHLRVARGE